MFCVGKYEGLKMKQRSPRTLWIFGKLDQGPPKPMTLGFVTQNPNLKDVCRPKQWEKQGRGVENQNIKEKFGRDFWGRNKRKENICWTRKSLKRSLDTFLETLKEVWPNWKCKIRKYLKEFRQVYLGRYSRKLCDWLNHIIGLMWQAYIGGRYVD